MTYNIEKLHRALVSVQFQEFVITKQCLWFIQWSVSRDNLLSVYNPNVFSNADWFIAKSRQRIDTGKKNLVSPDVNSLYSERH